GSLRDEFHVLEHVVLGDLELPPHGAFGVPVGEQGGEAVDGSGEPRLGGFAFFELVPQVPCPHGLVFGQEREDAARGGTFPFRLGAHGGLVVDVGVSGVDFHDVVHQQHVHHVVDVGARGGVFGEYASEYRHVPGVLGRVFAAGSVNEQRTPQYALELVDLQ